MEGSRSWRTREHSERVDRVHHQPTAQTQRQAIRKKAFDLVEALARMPGDEPSFARYWIDRAREIVSRSGIQQLGCSLYAASYGYPADARAESRIFDGVCDLVGIDMRKKSPTRSQSRAAWVRELAQLPNAEVLAKRHDLLVWLSDLRLFAAAILPEGKRR